MNKKIISFYPIGRLGNQLFQFLAAYAYSLKYGLECRIPNDCLLRQHWPNIPVLECHINYLPNNIVHNELNHTYNEIPGYGDCNLILSGFYQSEKYFSEYRGEIIEILGVPSDHQKCLSYFIHIRIGDYKLYPTKHPIVGFSYLFAAVSTMYELTGLYEDIMLLSDTRCEAEIIIEQVKEMFYIKYGRKLNYTFTNLDEINDLRLMTLMDHGIIANSTFSWFGAWLINNPDKIIISPSADNWFGEDNKHLDSIDIIPDSWIQIKY